MCNTSQETEQRDLNFLFYLCNNSVSQLFLSENLVKKNNSKVEPSHSLKLSDQEVKAIEQFNKIPLGIFGKQAYIGARISFVLFPGIMTQ